MDQTVQTKPVDAEWQEYVVDGRLPDTMDTTWRRTADLSVEGRFFRCD